MLDWLFKKYSHTVKSPPAKTTERAADKRKAAAQAAAQAANSAVTASPEPKKPAAPDVDWAAQLQAAQGDDAALLTVAQNATVLDIKLAAVQALAGEATLKLAERAFRNHDRKVHRLAKQRMEAAVQQRTSRATAQRLLEQTQKLLQEPQLAINQLVELDKSWQALPAHALEAAQTSAFAELRARLNTQMLERSNAEQQVIHWTADSKALLAACPARLLAATEPGQTETALALRQELQALIHAQPAVETAGPAQGLTHALAQALTQAQAVHAHLQVLDTVPGPADELPADPSANLALNPAVREALSSRHQQWQQLHRPAPAAQAQTPRAAAERPSKPPRVQPLEADQLHALESLLQQAQAALAGGQLSELQHQLQAMDTLLTQARAVLPESLRERHQALWAEHRRLKDWQQWGGARARDDLADEAQALARATLPVEIAVAANAATADPATSATVLPPPRLNLKAHNDAIRTLRQRWKELDRHSAPATQAQWQRFDAALQVAYAPVAAQVAANKQAREHNLSEREALLATLEALQLPTGEGDGAPDWKALTRDIDRLQTAWRKLGPLEHTAPHAAQKGLQTRLHEALARLEAPLQAARANAAAQREQLIARAERLIPSSPHGGMSPEATRQVRDLQMQWQDQARQLPLPRGLENALWARFKTATDAVFAQRQASFAARDAELAANLAHAEALIHRLQALSEATALPDVASTLADVDKAWRQGGELPRGADQALEPRYRAARDHAWALVNQARQQQWMTQCSTLASKLQLCAEREALAPAAPAPEELLARWAALPPLPAAWEQPLAQRWACAANPAGLSQPALEDVLLRLEMALGLPATAQLQAARQQLKLRALKETMEGRGAPTDGPAQQLAWWQSALKQGEWQPDQALRLQALLAALQTAPAGTLLPR